MTSAKSWIGTNGGTASLLVVLVASLGLNVYLGLKVRKGSLPPPIVAIKAGAQLPSPLALVGVDGKPAELTFDGSRPTVIYVFSPVCEWCKRNEGNIKSLAINQGAKFRFVGLSLIPQNLKQYIEQGHAPFPVYVVRSAAQARELGLVGTPTTLVVASGGKVEKVWQGAYMEDSQRQVENFFDVKLPGLQQLAVVK